MGGGHKRLNLTIKIRWSQNFFKKARIFLANLDGAAVGLLVYPAIVTMPVNAVVYSVYIEIFIYIYSCAW